MRDHTAGAGPPYRRRGFLRAAGLGAAAALAGCQGQPGGDDTPSGTVRGTRRGFTRPFKLGMLTTPDGLGATHTNSMHLAVDHLNEGNGIHDHEQSGIGGQDVEFLLGNTTGGPSSAKQAYRKVTKQDGADATFGALSVKALMPLIAEEQKLHFSTATADAFPAEIVSTQVSPIGGDPEAEYERYKYHFRSGPLAFSELRKSAVEVIQQKRQEMGWQNISILIENSEDAQAVVDSLETAFTQDVGVNVPVAKTVSGSLSNWTPIFDELEGADTDLAFITLVLGGTSFVNQWADQQRDFEAGGIHIFSMLPDFWNQTNGAVEGIWTMNAMTPQTTNNQPYTQDFMRAYNERFDGYPLYAGPIAYDAIHHYKYAVEELGTRNPERLVTYLEEDFTYSEGTVIPEMEFKGPDNRLAHDPVWESTFDSGVPVYQQWQSDEGVDRPNVSGGGIMEAFAPEQNQSAPYVKPPWMR